MNYIKSIFIILLALSFNGMFGFPPWWNPVDDPTATSVVVDNTSDSQSCEGDETFYHTIQDAIDGVGDNSTIYICDGIYNESLTVDKDALNIKKSDSATGDVIITNNDYIFKLNNIHNISLDSLTIISNSKDGINSSYDVGSVAINRCNITAGDDGIDMDGDIDNLIIINSNIDAYDYGIKADNYINGNIQISTTSIKANNKDGIYFGKNLIKDINITNCDINAGDDGVEFVSNINGKVNISDSKIQSVGHGLYFKGVISNGIAIDTLEINSSNDSGIKILGDVNNYCNFNNLNISSYGRGIYISSRFIEPIITNSSIDSINGDAIYTRTRNRSKMRLRDNCLRTHRDRKFGLYLYINNTNSDIVSNCFYATTTNTLAKSKRKYNNFDNNYWDGHIGDYNMNNIYDNNPAEYCRHRCWGQNNGGNNRFDAWDVTKNINDRNISTKRSSQQFSIFIASLNETDDNFEKFNGTVCSCIDGDSSTCFKNLFVDSNNSEQTAQGNPTFNIDKSYKDVNIDIHWQNGVDLLCSDLVEDNNTKSTDNFAIIPTKFILDINDSNLKAGENYTLTIKATNSSGIIIPTYEQTFNIDENDKNLSLFFNSKVDGLEFNKTYTFEINGSGYRDDFSIDDVGEYLIRMVDINYAFVDEDDTNLSDRKIDGNITVLVKPHHFDINITKHQISTLQDWGYMAQDFSDMNYTLTADLSAKNKQDQTTIHFDKDEYARDINTTINFDTNMTDSEIVKFYNQFDTNFDIDKNEFNTSKDSFNDGISKISLVYKIDKIQTSKLRPIRTNIKDFDLPDLSDDEKQIESLNDDITWYYSKLITYDVITNKEVTPNYFFVLLYKEDTKNFKEVTLNWFKNEDDNSSITTGFGFTPSSNTIIDNTTNHIVDFIDYRDGKVDYNITRDGDKKAIIHIAIPKYLWYNYGIDSEYNISSGSNCIQHPCSIYTYKKVEENSTHSISSGKYQGGKANVKAVGDIKRFGVKVFR